MSSIQRKPFSPQDARNVPSIALSDLATVDSLSERRSLAGSRARSRSRHTPRPSNDQVYSDGSSRTTTAANSILKPPHEAINARDTDRNSTRTNSDPSSTASRRPDLQGWDERDAVVPKNNLTVLDVAALILNKQIGTGIFTTPGAVLLATGSKNLSIALWSVGGLWTLLFLFVYLEFGNALPFNGGELVYLDEIFYRPELLATVLFSAVFLSLANSYGNSIQFAKHILIAAIPDLGDSKELDPRLVRYVAISVITLVCGIHWFSARAGLFLNKLVALYKTILLFVVFVAGMSYSAKHGSEWHEPIQRTSSVSAFTGMVSIFYSYQGWENANYVAGEIKALEGRTPKRTLNIGAVLGVTTVWILYVLVTISLYRVLDFEALTGPNSDLAAALKFAPEVFGSSTAFKICMALSAFGNVLAVTYTASKVKQSIAIQRILPFWRYLQKDGNTPKGALFLHWLTSVIYIGAAPTNADGYSFAIGIYTYSHVLISTFVAFGLVKLQKRMQSLPEHADYRLTFFRNKAMLYTVPIFFGLANLVVLGFAAHTHNPGKIPRWWWPITMIILLAAGFVYWAGMYVTMLETKIVNEKGERKRVGDIIGFNVSVYYQDNAPPGVKEDIEDKLAAKIDGSRRRVVVQTSGWLAGVSKGYDRVKDLLERFFF